MIPRLRYLCGRSDLPRTKRIPCGTVYVMLRNRTAELMIELKAVVEAK